MEADPAETKNLIAAHPEVARRLRAKLQAQIDAGVTRLDAQHKNDTRVVAPSQTRPDRRPDKKSLNKQIPINLVPCAAHAAVITHVVNVDFDNLGAPSGYNGQGAVPAAGNLWTHTSAASLAALPDSLGGATGVGFTRTNFTNFGSIGPTNSLLQDYAFSVVPGGFSLTMNGLDPSTVYDLILYGAQDGFGGRGTLWTVTDDTGVLPSQLTDASDFSGTGFVLGSTYTIFSNLVPTAGGNLFVSGAQEAANGVSFLNGFQTRWNTTTVPEPGTIVSLFTTLLVGFAALWRTRAREPITN